MSKFNWQIFAFSGVPKIKVHLKINDVSIQLNTADFKVTFPTR